MIVTCPACTSRYRIAEDKVQGRGARITCPNCAHKFIVYREQDHSPVIEGLAARKGVPVTIARNGALVRRGMENEPEEEAPTTLMPHGSSLSAEVRSVVERSQNRSSTHDTAEPAESPPPAQAWDGPPPARGVPPPAPVTELSARTGTYLTVAVATIAVLALLFATGILD